MGSQKPVHLPVWMFRSSILLYPFQIPIVNLRHHLPGNVALICWSLITVITTFHQNHCCEVRDRFLHERFVPAVKRPSIKRKVCFSCCVDLGDLNIPKFLSPHYHFKSSETYLMCFLLSV